MQTLKLKFTGKGGYELDNIEANKILTVGETYEVTDVEVSSWNTNIKLVGFDRTFNSVMFEGTDVIFEEYNRVTSSLEPDAWTMISTNGKDGAKEYVILGITESWIPGLWSFRRTTPIVKRELYGDYLCATTTSGSVYTLRYDRYSTEGELKDLQLTD